ncbi:50S ribosomal protein L7/L12 [Mycoplasmopsis pullorum]|uniref:Large ribosomal subunit protein bL12 n=1 Tax=Mycoplasmopsis pullorum TaxID=48003 RepID=A0A1L4FSE2_9BACT|nr:50S ribosomal protein L7/L12 [Mycoplasmopsis pullorum]APJ38533.1 50S ribosomal protein L7/L12 [Mycoplasmopsis pullorum]TNK81799.1 50S ribosomal protein L7/L12 [Mycoplasmopsis pullorum]TNK83415.1 50S ribosomal protein L7/L12 [Mycoplasmopsis pullorum]TNK83959.1 50S ribosomal protein L7/L12 [Mycoplasmopsis pullorum]TNK85070.1 50S ribosomal protein L7/L12 [Mycoplasmopsis pullorum]
MAKLTKESFIESLKEMNIKEIMELVDALKEEFGVDPMAAVAVAAAPAAAAEEKSEVTVTLNSASNKVAVIKVVKDILNIGLMDAKKLVDALPAKIKENIKPEEAEEIKAKLVEAGAEVSID